jgi:Mn2+/Fe2+ NRAMP family transporter
MMTAVTLHKHGITKIETSKQAAEALRPLAGQFAYLLYSMGIIGVGLLAIPVLAGSAAYALAETFDWRQGIDRKFGGAHEFYAVIIVSTLVGVLLDFLKVNPMKALYWTAVLNGLLAPFLLVGILLVSSDRKIMLKQPSSKSSRLVVLLVTVLMFGAAIGMFVF